MTRGLINNNPGNIRHSSQTWVGQATEQHDPDFVTFKSAAYGIRALVKTLLTYQTAHGCKTIRQMIARWAPPNENDTAAYIADVSTRCGVSPDQTVDAHNPEIMTPLVKAIIRHENGSQPYPDSTIAQGLSLAGIGPTPPPAAAQGQPQAA